MKRCSKCKEWKDRSEFYARKASADGLQHKCKGCRRAYMAEHRDESKQYQQEYYLAHKPHIQKRMQQVYVKNKPRYRERSKAWIEAHPEETKTHQRRYFERHRERVYAKNKRIRANNPGRQQEYNRRNRHNQRAWMKRHPEYMIAASARRRARVLQAPGKFTSPEWQAMREFFGNICLRCKEALPLCADHVVPLACGGSNWISNIQPLCKSCNSTKHTNATDYRDPQRLAEFLAAHRPSHLSEFVNLDIESLLPACDC